MKYELVFIELSKEKRKIFVAALQLEKFGDKTLVATFKKDQKKEDYITYVLSPKAYPKLNLSLKFNGNIFLINSSKVKYPNLDVSLSEKEMHNFVNTIGLIDLNAMSEEDFKAFVKFASKYYKDLVKEGSVIPIIKDKNGKLCTYFVEEKTIDGMICVPLSYESNQGLRVKSFDREFIPYEVYITDIFYSELQEERIKRMLEETTLKLK